MTDFHFAAKCTLIIAWSGCSSRANIFTFGLLLLDTWKHICMIFWVTVNITNMLLHSSCCPTLRYGKKKKKKKLSKLLLARWSNLCQNLGYGKCGFTYFTLVSISHLHPAECCWRLYCLFCTFLLSLVFCLEIIWSSETKPYSNWTW